MVHHDVPKLVAELHAAAYRERLDVEPDVEIWLADSEGAWVSREREQAFRVSETGSEISNLKTMQEWKDSKFWPLIKDAMEEEIHGKMVNGSWECVERPEGQKCMKSRWVIAVKLNDDNSIKEIKMRFVACGYSQGGRPGLRLGLRGDHAGRQLQSADRHHR